MNSFVFHTTPQTTRTYDQIVGDVDMFRRAKAIREWLCELSGLSPRLNEGPNPYYQGTVDGLTLIQYYGGPSCVGTPFGSWAATGGGCLTNPSWFKEAKERLGLVVVMDEYQNQQGCYGPVHAITRDLDGNVLPATDYRPQGLNFGGITAATAFSSGMLPFSRLQADVEAHPTSAFFKERLDSLVSLILNDPATSANGGGVPLFPSVADAQRVYEIFADELRERLWAAMKPNIGFRDWEDEKKSA